MKRNRDGRGSRPIWFLALFTVIFALYSAAVAAGTADDCDRYGGAKTWRVLPPGWECNVDRGR